MLGGRNDNNSQQRKSPVVFSGYSMTNTFSNVDKTKFRPSFWNQMLKLEIIPAIPTGEDKVNWDYKNAMAAYLTHTKAKIMAEEVKKFLSDPEKYNSSGIISGETLLTISNGEEFGTPGVFLVMRKVDKQTGNTLSTYSFEFNVRYYNSIRNYKESDSSFDTDYDSYVNLEVEQFLQLLESYVEAMTYATAYSVIDASSYRQDIMMETINSIASGLGIDVSRSGPNTGATSKSSKSVFNQRGNQSSSSKDIEHTTIEDIEGDLFD